MSSSRGRPSLCWFRAQTDTDLFVAALTVGEIWRGVLEQPKGKKRSALEAWFSGPEGPQALFAGRDAPRRGDPEGLDQQPMS
jgi:toxin FitB